MQNKLLFLDVESTGVDTEDRLYQVAWKLHQETVNEMFKPPLPISHVASSITHVTTKDVAGKAPFIGSPTHAKLAQLAANNEIFIAHNAQFDLKMVSKEGITFKQHICTLKLAHHIDEGDMVKHTLQYLRYYYDLEIDLGDLAPHDALADIIVLEAVFKKLARSIQLKYSLTKEGTIKKMLEISMNPVMLKKITFGKYSTAKGATPEQQLISNIAKNDKSYLVWLLNEKRKNPEGEEDFIYTLSHYLK